jgi:DNA-binding MarR family transcriptional regulator
MTHAHHSPVLQAILNISKASSFLNEKVDEAIKQLEITNVQYNILRILNRNKDTGTSRVDILRQLIDKNTDLTRSIHGLVKAGYVQRARPESDRRLVLHLITESGITALRQIDPLFLQMIGEIEKRMTAQEWEQLSVLCKQLFTPPYSPLDSSS